MQKSNFLSIKQLVISAVCVALATVLSMLKIYEFPFGGSITAFSMLFICLPGIIYGLPIGQVIVDYGLAFAALGLSGIFHTNKNSFTLGYIVGIIGRYIFAVISGYVFFAEYAWSGWGALPYSLCYNGAYIFTEGVLTIIILNIPPIKKSLNTLKMQILN